MISLRRQIKVECFTALAEIGVTEKREEIVAILKLAEKRGGYISASQVNTELLGRPPTSTHGQRILLVVESYGLLEKAGLSASDESYRMTEAGWENSRKQEIMVPEEGGYVLYTTNDPLFKEHILKIERTTGVEENEARGYFGNRHDRASLADSKSVEKPSYLSGVEPGHILRQVCNGNELVQINSISEKVASSKKELGVTVSLELDQNTSAKMKVKSDGKELYADTLFDLSYMQVMQALTKDTGQLEMSNQKEPILLMKWEDVDPKEAEQFRKEIRIDKPIFGKFESFEPLKFPNAIFPQTQKDAVNWGNYLLKQSITTYLDESDYVRLVRITADKFRAKFDSEKLALQLIGFDAMLSQVVEERKTTTTNGRYWFLAAPKDLTMK